MNQMLFLSAWLSVLTIFLYVFSIAINILPFVGTFSPGIALTLYLMFTFLGLWKLRRKLNADLVQKWQKQLSKSLAIGLFFAAMALILTNFIWIQPYSSSSITLEKENAHDTWWHLALMTSLNNSVPPENPIFSGQQLTGYHYFNDLLWVAVHQLTFVPLTTLYLTVAPLAIAIFFVATAWWLMKQVSRSNSEVMAGTVLLTIGSGLAFLAPLFFADAQLKQSVFWLDQPTHYAFNQQLLLSLALVNILLGLFLHQKLPKWAGWIVAVILTALAGIKVYAVLVFIPALCLSYGWWWLKGHHRSLLWGWLAGSVGAGLIMLSAKGETGWPFIFFPGYFFKTMFEASDRLNQPVWELQRQTFVADSNYLRLVIHWLLAALVFYLGNFGIKVVGLIGMAWLLVRRQVAFSPQVLLLLMMIVGSWLAPALFIQKGVVWNTVQFLHFAQAPLVVLLLLSWQKLMLPKSLKKLLMAGIVIVALPTTILSVYQTQLQSTVVHVDSDSLSALEQAGVAHVSTGLPLLVSPDLTDTAMVPALAGYPVYFTDPAIVDILGLTGSERFNQTMTKAYCPPSGGLFVYQTDKQKIAFRSCSTTTDIDPASDSSGSATVREEI